MNPPRPIRSRFLPRVEALEDRCLLSAGAKLNGTVLTITGTRKADQIQINDDGNRVGVIINHHFEGSFNGVATVDVNSLGGRDRVLYDVLGTASSQLGPGASGNVAVNRTLNADLGKGHGLFVMEVLSGLSTESAKTPPVPAAASNLGAQSNLNLTVHGAGSDTASLRALSIGAQSNLQYHFSGGAGHNQFDAVLGGAGGAAQAGSTIGLVFTGGRGKDVANVNAHLDLAAGAALSVSLDGGAGNDTEKVNYSGQDNGTLKIQTNGGDGKDTLDTEVTLSTGSTGTVKANENGGAGNDDLTMALRKATSSDTATLSGTIDGGPGKDTCSSTSNVTSTNCEVMHVLT